MLCTNFAHTECSRELRRATRNAPTFAAYKQKRQRRRRRRRRQRRRHRQQRWRRRRHEQLDARRPTLVDGWRQFVRIENWNYLFIGAREWNRQIACSTGVGVQDAYDRHKRFFFLLFAKSFRAHFRWLFFAKMRAFSHLPSGLSALGSFSIYFWNCESAHIHGALAALSTSVSRLLQLCASTTRPRHLGDSAGRRRR